MMAEVEQLTLSDFIEVEGIPCFRITDEEEGQSVKSDISVQTARFGKREIRDTHEMVREIWDTHELVGEI